MKTSTRLLIAALGFAACAFLPACQTTATVQTLGPLVAEVAQARIAKEVLDRNPSAAPKLEAVADALDALTAAGAGDLGEVTDAAIRAFVSSRSAKWGLTAPEAELLTQGLLATRAAYLDVTKLPAVHLGDPQVRVWIDAVKRGIRAGVAAHQAAG